MKSGAPGSLVVYLVPGTYQVGSIPRVQAPLEGLVLVQNMAAEIAYE